MNTRGDDSIRVLIADDDEHILECYKEAFGGADLTEHTRALDALDAELFDDGEDTPEAPIFEVVSCSQGAEAIEAAKEAANDGHPFDVVILDVRMPGSPLDGVTCVHRQVRGRMVRELIRRSYRMR